MHAESPPPAVPHCPRCGNALEHVPRTLTDRWVALFRPLQHYRCPAAGCGWEGVLGCIDSGAVVERGPIWRTRALWFVLGAATALAGAQGLRMWRGKPAPPPHPAQVALGGAEQMSQATPAGRDFDGEPLPAQDERVTRNRTPLTLRNSCSWGVPGSNKYRGTVEQALVAARLPPEVVKQISTLAERGWSTEQVEISRAGIRTVNRRQEWGSQMLAMAFGTTLCFNTRVNFVPGHVEYGNLYTAADSRGRNYTVIVPDICQNVAVLGERAETTEGPPPPNGAPEPEAFALVALGLGALAWSRRRSAGPGSR